MAVNIGWIWIAVAGAFVIGEMFTAGFFLLWFGVGAAVAGVLAIFGFAPVWQLGAFTVVSGLLVAVSRRFAERFTGKQPPGIGADRLIGKTGAVLEKIDYKKNTGRVRVEREEWRAESHTGEVLPAGVMVTVLRIDGTRLVVRTSKEGE